MSLVHRGHAVVPECRTWGTPFHNRFRTLFHERLVQTRTIPPRILCLRIVHQNHASRIRMRDVVEEVHGDLVVESCISATNPQPQFSVSR